MASGAPKYDVDDRTARGFSSWYRTLPQEPNLIRFFHHKSKDSSCYTVHGEDATLIAREFYKTTAVVKTPGGLATTTLNPSLFETVLREMLVGRADHTVEIYEGSGQAWQLARTGSPGKLGDLEDDLFRTALMEDAPVVMAASLTVQDGARTMGVAFCTPTSRTLGACAFLDDEHFCQLEALVAQIGAKECVLMHGVAERGASDDRRLLEVLERCGVLATEKPKAMFKTADLEQDLAKLLKGDTVELYRPVLDRPPALPPLAAVVSFLDLLADASNLNKYHLYLHDPGRFMRLDAEAQRALHVMPSKQDANDAFSLLGIMGRARTPMGRRLLRTWLKQPLRDVQEVDRRLDVVESMVSDAEMRGQLRDVQLRGMPDVERITRKLDRKRATLADLCQLYRASSRLPVIEGVLRDHEGPHAAYLVSRFCDPLAQAHDADHLQKFESLLEAAVDLDKVPDEYVICPRYSPDLEELAARKAEVEAEISAAAQQAASSLGLQLDKTVKLEWHRFQNQRTRCLRITAKEEKACRKKLSGGDFTILETRKDGTKFTSWRMRRAAEQLQAIEADYQNRQKALVEQVVSVASTFVEVWEGVSSLLAELDVLVGFADLSASAPTPYVRASMQDADGGSLELVGCRHPCLEAQDGVEFIKNDCVMRKGESWFQIISGPNMGGKSTFIRQVGVCVLMAQVGCFVPCDSATIPVRDAIFARVGAGDSQLRGVSTFMAEMLETASILKGASSRSLVIIDELGRGTSTYDGFGLAWAISEHLMERVGAPTLFATHFHELTALRGAVGVANRHVETAVDSDTGRLTMLYQVREGACDQSFGIHVAEYANFPKAVVEAARVKAKELEGREGGRKRGREGEGEGEGERGGRARLRKFLRDFAELPLDTLSADALLSRSRSLVSDLRRDASGDAYLESVMGAATLEHA